MTRIWALSWRLQTTVEQGFVRVGRCVCVVGPSLRPLDPGLLSTE